MRIPGVLLRTPILIEPSLGNTGDGDTYGTAVRVKAAVKTRVEVSNDATGQTITTWATCRIRPTTRIGGRTPAAGDRVTVNGVARKLASVAPVQGPGTAVSFLELVAGDG